METQRQWRFGHFRSECITFFQDVGRTFSYIQPSAQILLCDVRSILYPFLMAKAVLRGNFP